MTGLRWRLFWPVLLITVFLFALCVFTAMSLFHQQATVATVLREAMTSRRAAVEIEECLRDLVELENARVGAVTPLHDRLRIHLIGIRAVANEPEERRLADRLEAGYAEYLRRWQTLPPPAATGHDAAFRAATRYLEAEMLPLCNEFRVYNDKLLEETTDHHERVLRQLAWGMAGIGGLGGGAGLVLGFGLARGVAQSIGRLRVQLRDAAGKLGPDLPEIVLTEDGEFSGLHQQLDHLTRQIEEVVGQLQQREREVLRAEQLAAVGQLAAGVGHEIRNPLTSIKMLVQAGLEDEGQPGLTTEDLRIIESEIRRVERSLQTFLDLARPPRPERRQVDLLAVISGVLGLVRGRAEKQRVTTRLAAPGSGVTLTADPGQLQQVLVNVVLNAFDAMPTGGTLFLTVRTAGTEIEVEITDTGPGIPAEILPRLFQPFVSSKDTGLGLGLVICRRIVEDHGGRIGAVNLPGGGASFFVRLPYGPPPTPTKGKP